MLFADTIYSAAKAAFEFKAEIGFSAYVRKRSATKWVIAADFVNSGPERINDIFAFTIHLYEKTDLSELLASNNRALPNDMKKIKHLNTEGANFLADPERFHFCFVPDRVRHQLGSWDNTQAALKAVVDHVANWPNSSSKAHYLKKFSNLAERAKKSTFNYPLLHDITLLATLTAYICLLIAKHSRPEIIMLAFDRDAMTTAFNAVFYDLAYLDFHSLCDIEHVQRNRILFSNAVDPAAKNGDHAWFDDLIRTSDYVAGAIARWNFLDTQAAQVSPKVGSVIYHAIMENPNIAIFRIRCCLFEISFVRVFAHNKAMKNPGAYYPDGPDIIRYVASKLLREERARWIVYRDGICNTSSINNVGLRIWWRQIG